MWIPSLISPAKTLASVAPIFLTYSAKIPWVIAVPLDIKCFFNSGLTSSNDGGTSTVQYVEFATLGDGMDFGDSTAEVYRSAGCSNGHGGL